MTQSFQHKLKSKLDQNHFQKIQDFPRLLQIEDQDQQILFQNWGSFFVQNKMEQENVQFFLNSDFDEQQKISQIDQNDINIPGNKSFWFVITKDGIFVLSSRRNTLTQFRYNFLFKNFKQGLTQDLGSFDEGFCTQAETLIEKMVICFSDKIQQQKFQNLINEMSKLYSEVQNSSLEFQAQLRNKENYEFQDFKKRGPEGEKIESKIFDTQQQQKQTSEWEILQDWSTCTQACGGGSQTRQLQCKIGKDKLPCQGDSIQIRKCNEQSCLPDQSQVLPMKIKTFQISQRPQREERCVIKEGDLDLIRDDLIGFVRPPRTPVRAVMNNSTFSIFAGINLADNLFSTSLKDLTFLQDKQDQNCLVIANQRTNQIKRLCSLNNLQNLTPKDNIQSWENAINLFKYDCQEELKIVDKKYEDDIIVKLKQQAIENEKRELSFNIQLDPSNEIKKSFKEIQENTVNALQREMKFENLVEQEEIEKIQDEQKDRRIEIEKAKENIQCLERQKIKQDMFTRVKIEKNGIQSQIDQIKDSIKQMILEQRVKQGNKIKLMRDLSRREKIKDDQELRQIKQKMQQQLVKNYKKGYYQQIQGDKEKCQPFQTQDQIELYCNNNIIDDPEENIDCKNPKEFCFVCCDNEFGGFNTDERLDCLKMCQLQYQKKEA